ncbi:23S rRNA (adenine(2503)-C(2))-methyltransferase RlmN [Candidatus Peregrinibacteria bacterium]|nr:23S rRNA (adenine(2503)-C(2))-methyltransferase RlmN [Candidatus Peregrinibacteria bacterium]
MKFLGIVKKQLKEHGIAEYRANQIFKDVFHNGIDTYDEMTTLPAYVKDFVKENVPIYSIVPHTENNSDNGNTHKVLFTLEDGNTIEAVLMRFEDGRNTVCVSSQVGCAMNCRFCATGTLKFKRNLTYEEIADQVLYFAVKMKKEGQRVNHVVYMGMGEPLLNYKQVEKSIDLLRDKTALHIGSRNITVSTCGIVPEIKRFSNDFQQVNLAVSLHAPNDRIRNTIMPVSKQFPLENLMDACREYTEKTHRRITFEYVMLHDINDGEKEAHELARLLRGMLCLVNLIPYNETAIKKIQGSSSKRINTFKSILESNGIQVTKRVSLGQDIDAACGQLARKQ